jgi:hypothetical protein
MATVLVDARNVLRSQWPNIPEDELVELCRQWGEEHGHDLVVVFDGRAPEGAVGTGSETADDWIVCEAGRIEDPYWLVTSDRELRERAGADAERVIGGGTFARLLKEGGFE